MAGETIHVEIDKDGSVVIETKGYSGAECEKATAELEKQLGKRTANARTADYHKPGKQRQQQ